MNLKLWHVSIAGIKQKYHELVNIAQRISTSYENYRAVAESGSNTLNLDHIPQAESYNQKEEIVKKKQLTPNWVTCAKPHQNFKINPGVEF